MFVGGKTCFFLKVKLGFSMPFIEVETPSRSEDQRITSESTQASPSRSSPFSPRHLSEEEPGAPGRPFPITLPQDGGLQMAPLMFRSRGDRPCGLRRLLFPRWCVCRPHYLSVLGQSTQEILKSRLEQP